MKQWVALLAAAALAASVDAFAEPDTLDACKKMRARIEHYDSLRRHGGSATQMESWKKSRVHLEEQYRAARCRTHGRAVRKPG